MFTDLTQKFIARKRIIIDNWRKLNTTKQLNQDLNLHSNVSHRIVALFTGLVETAI